MSFHHRVRTIYGKELIDILRDRRTLIAMIVVPIVLYPLLMVGSIQAVSIQGETLASETIRVGLLDDDEQSAILRQLIVEDMQERHEGSRDQGGNGDEARKDEGTLGRSPLDNEPGRSSLRGENPPIHPAEIRVRPDYADEEALKRAVRQREIQLGLIFETVDPQVPFPQVRVTPYYDKEEIRSLSAYNRIFEMLERARQRFVRGRLTLRGLPETFTEPILVEPVDLSSPPSILGQILPLVLVLMTITGAIYPAIDVTAGERERGTLETLMVCPVPVVDLIVGKFLVVTTIAILGAALNLASVCATVYFGGFNKLVAAGGGGIPYAQMAMILICLVPFAVLMSAIMLAVCSYARTFKEAQNYVTPVILAVLIPGGIAAMPAARLDGIMLVVPVGNMVLLARELLIGSQVPVAAVIMVTLSTTLYAGAAVAAAARVFGKESVVFADAGSLRSLVTRRLIRPADRPSVTMSLMVVSLLYPTWFFAQSMFSQGAGHDARRLLELTAVWMPILFVGVPAAIMAHWKVSFRGGFVLRRPRVRFILAGALLGVSAWVPAHEISVLMNRVLGTPPGVVESAKILGEALVALPAGLAFLYIAVIPGVCEELLFRGFLLGGLSRSARRGWAIAVSALIFGLFHFVLFKIPVTVALGALLGWLCWQARSIWPAMLAHVVHNAIGVLTVLRPQWPQRLGIVSSPEDLATHLPPQIIIAGLALVAVACWLSRDAEADGAIVPAVPLPAHG